MLANFKLYLLKKIEMRYHIFDQDTPNLLFFIHYFSIYLYELIGTTLLIVGIHD